jgi:hypothetical protein
MNITRVVTLEMRAKTYVNFHVKCTVITVRFQRELNRVYTGFSNVSNLKFHENAFGGSQTSNKSKYIYSEW